MPAKIYYHSLNDETRRQDKLDWLRNTRLQDIDFEHIIPDDRNNWLNQTDNDFETLLPLASKEVKNNKAGAEADQAVFKLFSPGINTARDEWVYDFNEQHLEKKNEYFIEHYNFLIEQKNFAYPETIKWSASLKIHFSNAKSLIFTKNLIRKSNYRPFHKLYFYAEKMLNDRLTENHYSFFGKDIDKFTQTIGFSINDKGFNILGLNSICDFHFIGDTTTLPLYRYTDKGERVDNITDWAVERFKNRYSPLIITKELIFHYVYAVLHNPAYRAKYEQNLKRNFPRIPFYDDFERWAAWGKALMDLHVGYEQALPFGLEVVHRAWVGEPEQKAVQKTVFNEVQEIEPLYKKTLTPKTKLKADKLAGMIELDEKTYLRGIPAEAWDYKLGNRSALEWILDQYKESKPSDPTILEKFNTYRFADYKTQVIDLLQRVCTVSVETMKIVRSMK